MGGDRRTTGYGMGQASRARWSGLGGHSCRESAGGRETQTLLTDRLGEFTRHISSRLVETENRLRYVLTDGLIECSLNGGVDRQRTGRGADSSVVHIEIPDAMETVEMRGAAPKPQNLVHRARWGSSGRAVLGNTYSKIRLEIRVELSEVLEVGACDSAGRRTQTAPDHGRQSAEEVRVASRDVRRSRHREPRRETGRARRGSVESRETMLLAGNVQWPQAVIRSRTWSTLEQEKPDDIGLRCLSNAGIR